MEEIKDILKKYFIIYGNQIHILQGNTICKDYIKFDSEEEKNKVIKYLELDKR